MSWDDVKKILSELERPEIKPDGKTLEEKILSVFLNDEIRLGPPEFITKLQSHWLDKFSYFTKKGLSLEFTILGFPFKIPVPLKTNRTLPDMGEVLALDRLKYLADLIRKVYEPGARITVITEGAFGRFAHVPEKDWRVYGSSIREFITKLGFDGALKIRDISEMEQMIDNFEDKWQERIQELKLLYQKNDPEFIKKYQGTYDSVYRIVSTKGIPEPVLMDVYNENLSDEKVSDEVREIRKDLNSRAREAIFQYHAYLKMRDEIGFLDRVVPGTLTLSVSPKPKRLGIVPVNKESQILFSHGVPVYHPSRKQFIMEYLINLKRSQLNFTPIYLDEDKEVLPFYYLANE